jgi:hypothetical protein
MKILLLQEEYDIYFASLHSIIQRFMKDQMGSKFNGKTIVSLTIIDKFKSYLPCRSSDITSLMKSIKKKKLFYA